MKKIIAHRGQINGPLTSGENNPNQILSNIDSHPYLINEIDIWLNQSIYVGHDFPRYEIDMDFLINNSAKLILHIKNIDFTSNKVVHNLEKISKNCHIFCHEHDDFTITSRNWIWLHPRNGIKENCIAVMPEKYLNLDSIEDLKKLSKAKGICTDYALKVLKFFE